MITLTTICIFVIGILIGMFAGIAIYYVADELSQIDLSKPHDDYD